MNSRPPERRILVCESTGCASSKSADIRAALEREILRLGLVDTVEVDFTGCHGFCQRGPIVDVEPEGAFYCQVKPGDAKEIAESNLAGGEPVTRLYYRHPVTKEAVPRYADVGFYKYQQRLILRNCGAINPERIEDFESRSGYRALEKALTSMTPEQVVEEVKRSGLRGRGRKSLR